MTKTKRTYLALLAVLLSPMAANADIIRINYSGTVLEVGGTGFGYSVGDAAMGWFEFDTDDWVDAGDYTDLIGPVTSNTGDGGYADAEDFGEMCSISDCGAEGIFLGEGSLEYVYEDLYDGLGNVIGYSESEMGFYHVIEWFPGGEYQSVAAIFEFGYMNVCIYESCVSEDYENFAIFSVPEPGTLALLGIGLFGMALARRRRKV